MQSRFLIGGMAAVPEADGTRFAFLGGLPLPGMRLLGPLLRPRRQPLALRPSGGWNTASRPADPTAPSPPMITLNRKPGPPGRCKPRRAFPARGRYRSQLPKPGMSSAGNRIG